MSKDDAKIRGVQRGEAVDEVGEAAAEVPCRYLCSFGRDGFVAQSNPSSPRAPAVLHVRSRNKPALLDEFSEGLDFCARPGCRGGVLGVTQMLD